MDTPIQFWLVPFASLVALFFAWYFFRGMMRRSEGTERMQQIAAHVRSGAMAYLRQQYKVVIIVFLFLACFFDRRSFFGFGRVYRYADSYVCIGSYGPGCQ